MRDRIPANPGRMLITPESGAEPYYATLSRADNPTQDGTPISKNTLLKDSTAALYGLDENGTPDDALRMIFNYACDSTYIGAVNILEWAKSQTKSCTAITDTGATGVPFADYWFVKHTYASQGVWHELELTKIYDNKKYTNICNNGVWTGWTQTSDVVPLRTATLSTSWTASGSYFYQDVTVNGIQATDTPIVGIAPGSDNAANVNYSLAFSNVFRITTSANSIRAWARSKPTVAIPIQIKVVR